MALDEDLYDLLADLTTQSYFVALELTSDNPTEIWRDLAHAVIGELGPGGCPITPQELVDKGL